MKEKEMQAMLPAARTACALSLVMFVAILPTAASPVLAAGTDARPLLDDRGTTARNIVATPRRFNGFDGLHIVAASVADPASAVPCDHCTFLWLPDIDFGDGTIEVEVAGRPMAGAGPGARGFVGVLFRIASDASRYEGIYFRPTNAVAGRQLIRNRSVQYFSYPDHPWDRLRKEAPAAYEAAADVQPGVWFRLRIEVSGSRAELFVEGEQRPTLVVDDLKLGTGQRGGIGLSTEPGSEAWFRNLVVTHR